MNIKYCDSYPNNMKISCHKPHWRLNNKTTFKNLVKIYTGEERKITHNVLSPTGWR